MGISSFVIILEQDVGVYFPGQYVIGQVRAEVTSPTRAKSGYTSTETKRQDQVDSLTF